MGSHRLVFAATAFLFTQTVLAQFPVVGPRGAAMGGAAVAVADDGTALWTNPSGLARDPRIDIELFGGAVATSRNDFLGAADALSSVDLNRIRSGDFSRLPAALADLNTIARTGSGVVGSGTAGLVFGKSGFALGIGEVAYAGVYPSIDLVHVLPVSAAIDPAHAFANNTTGLRFAGLEAREARLGYGTSFFGKVLLVGGAVRYIEGRTYYVQQSAFDVDLSDPIGVARRAFDQNQQTTNKLAFDVGAMVNLGGIARLGVVSTAINQPTFSVRPDTGTDPSLLGAPDVIRLPRTLRAGAAVQPIGVVLVAVDYDLKETDTLIPGGRSRQLSAGVEVKLPLFAIRAGTFRDSAAPDPHWAYSAGFGLGLKMLSINAALVFSTEGGTSLSSTNRRDLGGSLDARFRF